MNIFPEITGVYFRENIHDYSKGTDFIFKGDKPVVIDFWASSVSYTHLDVYKRQLEML